MILEIQNSLLNLRPDVSAILSEDDVDILLELRCSSANKTTKYFIKSIITAFINLNFFISAF